MRGIVSVLSAMVVAGWLPLVAIAAEVTIQPVSVREGYFETPECKPEADPKMFNECLCKASIQKPQITAGVSPSVAERINKVLSSVPNQLAAESCVGTSVSAPETKIVTNEAGSGYEVVYLTPETLAVIVTYSTYGAGAAHPLGGTEGFTFNLKTGEQINPSQLLSSDQLVKANVWIHQELLRKYADSVFDETKSRMDPFLTENGCDTCTMYYTKDGWNVRFQLYAVAPYVTGEPTVTVPADVIADPQTLIAKR